jgi:hypothetical protein
VGGMCQRNERGEGSGQLYLELCRASREFVTCVPANFKYHFNISIACLARCFCTARDAVFHSLRALEHCRQHFGELNAELRRRGFTED